MPFATAGLRPLARGCVRSRARLLRVPPRNPLGQTVDRHVVQLRRMTLCRPHATPASRLHRPARSGYSRGPSRKTRVSQSAAGYRIRQDPQACRPGERNLSRRVPRSAVGLVEVADILADTVGDFLHPGQVRQRDRALNSRTPTSRCRSATAGRRVRARESPPGAARAATGIRVALRRRPLLPARRHARP